MNLSTEIIQQIKRLGGSASEQELKFIHWPIGNFNWSLARIRSQFPHLASMGEYEIEDHIHPVRELTFVTSNSGFWNGWIEDFKGTNPARFYPFSSDEAYFYFIDLTGPSNNPNVFYVDHETTDEDPYHPDSYTLEVFLKVL
ncbi:MAG: hypothetical protein ACKVH8_16790 [Pirellulales bacterium]